MKNDSYAMLAEYNENNPTNHYIIIRIIINIHQYFPTQSQNLLQLNNRTNARNGKNHLGGILRYVNYSEVLNKMVYLRLQYANEV